MREITARQLTAEAFAPYGEVLSPPAETGRVYIQEALANLRPGARPSFALALVQPVARLPVIATRMERHEYSSQSFMPLDPGRFLVIVAPSAPEGGPDASRMEAFVTAPGQGVTYGANVWHHPLSVIGAPTRFAIFMWLEGSKTDEEFVALQEPVQVLSPGLES